jgi:hypothetical protein
MAKFSYKRLSLCLAGVVLFLVGWVLRLLASPCADTATGGLLAQRTELVAVMPFSECYVMGGHLTSEQAAVDARSADRVVDLSSLDVPTLETELGGPHISTRHLKAYSFRDTAAEGAVWRLAAVDDAYLKMVELRFAAAAQGKGLSIAVSAAGYVTSYAYGITSETVLTEALVATAWQHRIVQDEAYAVVNMRLCFCTVLKQDLMRDIPVTLLSAARIPHQVVLTSAHCLIGGAFVTNGPKQAFPFRIPSSAEQSPQLRHMEMADWILAVVDDRFVKMVQIVIQKKGRTVEIIKRSSAYAESGSVGVFDSSMLTQTLVARAWGESQPTEYDVKSLSYYTIDPSDYD